MMERTSNENFLYIAALVSLGTLLAGTVLFPDTYASVDGHIGPVRVSALSVLLAVAAPSISLYAFTRRRELTIRTLDIFFVAFLVYIFMREALSASQENGGALLTLAYAAYAFLLYYGMAVVGQGKNALRVIITLLIYLVIVISAYALLEFFLNNDFLFGDLVQEKIPDPGRGYFRAGSSLGHPVVMGLFLVQAMPFLLYKYALVRPGGKKYMWVGIIVMAFLALEMSMTKGAWISGGILGVIAIVWLWRKKSARKPMIVVLVAISLALTVLTFCYRDMLEAGVTSETRSKESVVPRLYIWKRVPAGIAENPVFGAGMWQGVSQLYALQPVDPWITKPPIAIDNQYMTLIVEQGVTGLLLAMAVFFTIGRQAWKLMRARSSHATWAALIAASLCAVLINAMTFDSLMNWPNMVVFWLLAGALRALTELSHKGKAGYVPPLSGA